MSQAPPAAGSFFAELCWVHGLLRQDLLTCQALAAAAEAGAPASALRRQVVELRDQRPLFQLRFSCLRYCRFVHGHHGAEDAMLFPAVRRTRPELGSTVDRLEADHRAAADLLDEVERSALAPDAALDEPARRRLSSALRGLSERLLAHLDFEEESLREVLSSWRSWPDPDQLG